MRNKTPKPKKPFLSGYKTYNPEKEGFGNAEQWQDAFNARMGFEEASEILGDDDPFVILNVLSGSSWGDIKSAYRKMAMQHHPDRNGGEDKEFKRVQAAFEILRKRYDQC